jgi:hypothetical protein
MKDVVIWHNIGTDYQGRHIGFSDGYRPGHPLVPVYGYQSAVAGEPEDVANHAFRVFNVGDDPDFGKPDPDAQRYRALGNRSLSKGDVVQVGPTWLACASRGWDRVSAPEWIARSAQTHGTAPLPREIELPTPEPDEQGSPAPGEEPRLSVPEMAQLIATRSALSIEIRTGMTHSRGSILKLLQQRGITTARTKKQAWKDLNDYIVRHGGPEATRPPI